MKQRLWLKLSAILFISIVSVFFCFSWFFSVHQSRHFNHQSQIYLTEHFLVIYRHIQAYLNATGFYSSDFEQPLSKRKSQKSTFAELQDIFSLYTAPIRTSHFYKGLFKNLEKHSRSALTPKTLKIEQERSFFLIDSSGRILLHSESHYRDKKLPSSSYVLSLIKRYPKGWNRIVAENGKASSIITVARPITLTSKRLTFPNLPGGSLPLKEMEKQTELSSVVSVSGKKYFLIASQPKQKPGLFFSFHFKKTALFSMVAFTVLFLFIFFYLRSFISATDFLFNLFGSGGSLVRWNTFLSNTSSSSINAYSPLSKNKMEQKKALSYLAHTNNPYLKSMRKSLTTVLRVSKNKDKKSDTSTLEPTFLAVVNEVIDKSRDRCPHLQIHRELASDIDLPVFSDKLFQSLWELIKNAAQALSSGQAGALTIRTFKKHNRWFCCEVEDEGPGMDKQTLEQASRLHFTTKKHSTGLGLPFVQSVLSRMRGIVKLQS
ncbi:MAG: HAMP domain-containing sensor histidine kinase, partial [Bdellovibrionales bacterium]|nr:HAMP domain-containing sensor histidine kinase [Bdellovibrionales bacterium]